MNQFLKSFVVQKVIFLIMPKRARFVSAKRKLHKRVDWEEVSQTKKLKVNNFNLQSVREKMSSDSAMPAIEILTTPVKSANDKKEYKVIRLPNGLVACLISDPSNNFASTNDDIESQSEPESLVDENEIKSDSDGSDEEDEPEEKLAAASLCVGVGSFSDPIEIPGLAHFLEHMVFMGSNKYPQENEFDAFLKKRGGSDNASTDCESTTFYFECLEKDLAKALDMWSQFFLSPLMRKESMTREREAIESEFQMALPSDSHRKEHMLSTFSNKDSPVNKFMWGNLKTLRDDVSDDVLHQSVHEFKTKHYSAHRMTLAIQARLPLDVLQSYVLDCFSSIPKNDLPPDDFSKHTEVFNNSNFTRMYYVKPVKDVHQVELVFALPSTLHLYKSKPIQYVSWILGHEGKGSLLSYLKEKLWVTQIYTGNAESGMEYNSLYSIFAVTLVLTANGINYINEIIEAVFSYINLLKTVGPQERIYNEIKTIEDTNFRFKEEESASDFVEELSYSMHLFPPEDYLTGNSLYFEYRSEHITMVVDKLNPTNVNIMVLTTNLPQGIEFDKIEPWFSIPYTDQEISNDWIERWTKVEPYDCFSLPVENQFLVTNFDILQLPDNSVPSYPEKILSTDGVELWYKPDNKFKLPHAFMHYYFMNNMSLKSAANACMTNLLISILSFQITEEAYPAHVADLNYTFSSQDFGIIVKVNGYNEKLPLLLELVIKYIKDLPNTTTENVFNAVKEQQARMYYNRLIKPSKLAKSNRLNCLQNMFWSDLSKYNAISNISFEEFIMFSEQFLNALHIQGLIQGNMTKETAFEANKNLISMLNCQALSLEKIEKIRVAQIPKEKHCLKVRSFNQNDSNSITMAYYQIGPGNLKMLCTIEVLMLIMEEPLFDILRTKEQLGYDVYCTVNDTNGILGYTIVVNSQAGKFTTEHVDLRITTFVKNLAKTIKKMSNKEVNEIKENLKKVKQVADVHLKDEVSRNWTEIVQQDFMFDRIPKEIDAIQKIKTSDVKKWLDSYSITEKDTRKLCIQVVGYAKENKDDSEMSNHVLSEKSEDAQDMNKENLEMIYVNNIAGTNSNGYKFIMNIEKFRNELTLYPEHKIIS